MHAILISLCHSQMFELRHISEAFIIYLYALKYLTLKQKSARIHNPGTWKCLHAPTRDLQQQHLNAIYEADFIQTFHAHFRMHLIVFYGVISCQTLS